MSFRKRNAPLLGSGAAVSSPHDEKLSQANVRISPLTSHPTISTGTASLDKLLGLGAGLALGTSLLIEEEGTTDFASALLRCFAAEGIIQKQKVFVVAPDGWANQLPGVVEERASDSRERTSIGESERMKIAWRYENLGVHGEERRPPGGWPLNLYNNLLSIWSSYHAFSLWGNTPPYVFHFFMLIDSKEQLNGRRRFRRQSLAKQDFSKFSVTPST
jgi:elongator complex protein 4